MGAGHPRGSIRMTRKRARASIGPELLPEGRAGGGGVAAPSVGLSSESSSSESLPSEPAGVRGAARRASWQEHRPASGHPPSERTRASESARASESPLRGPHLAAGLERGALEVAVDDLGVVAADQAQPHRSPCAHRRRGSGPAAPYSLRAHPLTLSLSPTFRRLDGVLSLSLSLSLSLRLFFLSPSLPAPPHTTSVRRAGPNRRPWPGAREPRLRARRCAEQRRRSGGARGPPSGRSAPWRAVTWRGPAGSSDFRDRFCGFCGEPGPYTGRRRPLRRLTPGPARYGRWAG
jgi:hypothetical protein